LVKLVLFPLSLKAARTQRLMKELEGPIKEVRERYKDDREKQGKELLELYRSKGVNPLSGFVTLLVQLPVILGLYWVFLKGGLPTVNMDLLYSFVPAPQDIHMVFLGLVDMGGKSHTLALLAGITQFLQVHYAMPKPAPRSDKASFQEDFARSLHVQMKYVIPVVITFVAYVASAAVALYWITSNIFAIGQELYVRRQLGVQKATGVIAVPAHTK
jgi:YidC/Oxa1 family membrane protein insertase